MEQITFQQVMLVLCIYFIGVIVGFLKDAIAGRITNMIFTSWLYIILLIFKSIGIWISNKFKKKKNGTTTI